MKFTDRALAAIKPKPGERLTLSDEAQSGLNLRVTQLGVKVIYADYRFRKERRRVKIGPFPDITLKDARARVRKILLDVINDIDPAPSIATGPTVVDAVEEYERLYLPSLMHLRYSRHERLLLSLYSNVSVGRQLTIGLRPYRRSAEGKCVLVAVGVRFLSIRASDSLCSEFSQSAPPEGR